MYSVTLWRRAERPNYNTNVDLLFPYSELPHVGDYDLVMIPHSLNNLIPHLDYWGEGRVTLSSGVSGFTNSYNVNTPYRLVSDGQDRDRKIPNRIPVIGYNECDTIPYVKDDSVRLVTVKSALCTTSCGTDIARVINPDVGIVVAYGPHDQSLTDFPNLVSSLSGKGLFLCPGYELPSELRGLNQFKVHSAFVNVTAAKEQLLKLINNGAYDNAVPLAKAMNNEYGSAGIAGIVDQLLNGDNNCKTKLMILAWKLWNNGASDVVRNNFPEEFRLIFGQELVTIVNKGYSQALKLDANTDRDNDRPAWGDSQDKTSKRVSWRFVPEWSDNTLKFKLYNTDCNMYLKSAIGTDGDGDRRAYGASTADTQRHRYYLQPFLQKGTVFFYIINCGYMQGLKLTVGNDSMGDRWLFGHNGDIYRGEERFKWLIASWKRN